MHSERPPKPTSGRARSWDACLFDLDGTIADTVGLILACYRHTMTTHLGHAPPDERWIAGMGTPLQVQLREFARSAEEAEAMLATYRSFQRTVHDGMVSAYPGVPEGLARLASHGVRLAVVTSKHRELALRTLRVCGLDKHFDAIVTPEDVRRSKPDPEPVLVALQRLGIRRRDRSLFLGDAPVDLQAGRAAGVRTAAALWGPFPGETLRAENPDYLLGSFLELTEIRPPVD